MPVWYRLNIIASEMSVMKIMNSLIYATGTAYSLLRWGVISVILIVLFSQFVISIGRVAGESMQPTLKAGQLIAVDRINRRFGPFARGAVVQVRFPGDPDRTRYVKRIIGLPGDNVALAKGQIIINDRVLSEPYLSAGQPEKLGADQQWALLDDQYFLLGDNRAVSNDSRSFGPVEGRFIVGRVIGVE